MTSDERGRLEAAINLLRSERERRGGRLPTGMAQRMSKNLGVPISTLYRYINDGLPAALGSVELGRWHWCDYARAALMLCGGDVYATREYLSQDPRYKTDLPSVRWMQRNVHEDLANDEIALNKEGHAAARSLRIMLRLEVPDRNLLWLADHKQLDVKVYPPRGHKAVNPWFTGILEAKSRKLLGAALSLRPSQAHVLAALSQAIETAGTPRTFVFDRGLEFCADAIIATAGELNFAALPTKAYSPHHKGKMERVAQTLGRRTVRYLPHRTTQATDLRGRPRITILDDEGNPTDGMELNDLIPIFFNSVDKYNASRHSELKRSPNGAYREDAGRVPERRVAPEHLRRFLLKEAHRTIREHGLKFRNHWYYAEELDGEGKTRVEIRYRQDDLTRLEVYKADGTWWCTADLQDPASPEARERVLAHRRKRASAQAKVTRQARRMARRNFAAVTDGSQVARETTVMTQSEANAEGRGHSMLTDDALKLLNLETDTGAHE